MSPATLGAANAYLLTDESFSSSFRSSGGYSTTTWGGAWGSDYPTAPIKGDKISGTTTPQGLAAFSGRGPTEDGRFKPDIVAPGTDIISVRSRVAQDDGWGNYNTHYLYEGGTSMATPLVSGAITLIRQWLVDRQGIAEPPAALMKALLINGARDMTPGQYGTGFTQEITARPDRSQGFGHVNLYNALEPGDGNFLVFATNKFTTTGANYTTNIAVGQANAGKYVLTLAWQDYPGTSGASKALVNDLDLTVTSPSGTVYYPNNYGTLDHTNNVELIEFTFSDLLSAGYPAPTYTIAAAVSSGEYDFDGDTGYLYFRPANAGSFTFTCVASNEYGTATNTLTVTVTVPPVTVPELTVTDITDTTALATWTACDGVTTYTLQLSTNDFAAASGASVRSATPILSEDFAGFTGSGSADIGASLDNYTVTAGWTGFVQGLLQQRRGQDRRQQRRPTLDHDPRPRGLRHPPGRLERPPLRDERPRHPPPRHQRKRHRLRRRDHHPRRRNDHLYQRIRPQRLHRLRPLDGFRHLQGPLLPR